MLAIPARQKALGEARELGMTWYQFQLFVTCCRTGRMGTETAWRKV
jgi:hypothetical protein